MTTVYIYFKEVQPKEHLFLIDNVVYKEEINLWLSNIYLISFLH